MSIADLVGREFAKFEEAERFYWNYALAIGFSIRRSRLRRSEGGVVMGRQWVCSKEGSRTKKWTNRDDMIRTPRKETRENSHAAFAVKYCLKRDAYIVTKFVKEHNHRLANSHEENILANLFWRDSQSLHNYRYFGDVLIFDSTYKINVYDKPLVVFVGVNNHHETTIFGCAFLVDETADTYRWVLITFLTSVKDKKPVSIVTDEEEAMRIAIDEVFPDAHHRLCSWDIIRNVNSNVNNPKIVREFSYCVHSGLTPVAFEQHWQHMIDTYDLKDD
ncbi:unnamed protein product [Prunus armeniaca]